MAKSAQTVTFRDIVDYLQDKCYHESVKLDNMRTQGKTYLDPQIHRLAIAKKLYHLANKAYKEKNPDLFSSIF